ncbi:hypothetical protein CERSUDRAFT_57426 [Gelatoporia subvermispora B]|uniref:Uncharacterized protein n=1 Tax=Ceriporiopsis subvermispora (strain B) TaxID=914234 RepID=M2R4D4_CERS8|nr:hypothetical protein CERSUDRAFT_57426 [Gelatoporia subvermispora B]
MIWSSLENEEISIAKWLPCIGFIDTDEAGMFSFVDPAVVFCEALVVPVYTFS